MGNSHTHLNYEEIYHQVQDILQGYGQDIVMRDTRANVQPWGIPDLLVPASAIVLWIMQIAGKAIIEEIVKKTANKKKPEAEDIALLKERIVYLENLTKQLLEKKVAPNELHLQATANLFESACHSHEVELSINLTQATEELSANLVSMGFTNRKSKILASQLVRILPQKYIL